MFIIWTKSSKQHMVPAASETANVSEILYKPVCWVLFGVCAQCRSSEMLSFEIRTHMDAPLLMEMAGSRALDMHASVLWASLGARRYLHATGAERGSHPAPPTSPAGAPGEVPGQEAAQIVSLSA